jgi:hypothetical protein
VQAAQHLFGEFRRDFGLGVTALLQQRRQAPFGRIVVQAKGVERELEAAEHRAPGNRCEFPNWKGQPAARLALWRIDEAYLIVGHKQPRPDARLIFAQQPLKPLVWGGFPACQCATCIGSHTRFLDAHEKVWVAFGVDHHPVWFENSIRLLNRHRQPIRQRLTAGLADHLMIAPAEDARKEFPRIGERPRLAFRREASGDRITIRARLLLGHEAEAVENCGAEDEADGLDVAYPFEIGIDGGHVSCSSARGARGRRSPAGRQRHRNLAARALVQSECRAPDDHISTASASCHGAPVRPRPDRAPG